MIKIHPNDKSIGYSFNLGDKIMIPLLRRALPTIQPIQIYKSKDDYKSEVLESFKDIIPLLPEENKKQIEACAEEIAEEMLKNNPDVLSDDVLGSQPLQSPSGLIFAMKTQEKYPFHKANNKKERG